MSLRADSPVNPGRSLASSKAKPTAATSGLTPGGWFARYDPATCFWRTCQTSLFTHISDAYSGTWPQQGTMRNGVCWELATWVLPTAGNGSGYSWPTPRAGETSDQASQRSHWLSLSAAVSRPKMWPTPNVPNGGRTLWHAEQEGNSWYHDGKKVQLGLEQAVRIWATPSARDWRSGKASQETLEHNSRPLNEQVTAQDTGGALNPDWVESYLMAWPLGWSGAGPLNPQMFRAWLQEFRTALTVCVPSGTDR